MRMRLTSKETLPKHHEMQIRTISNINQIHNPVQRNLPLPHPNDAHKVLALSFALSAPFQHVLSDRHALLPAHLVDLSPFALRPLRSPLPDNILFVHLIQITLVARRAAFSRTLPEVWTKVSVALAVADFCPANVAHGKAADADELVAASALDEGCVTARTCPLHRIGDGVFDVLTEGDEGFGVAGVRVTPPGGARDARVTPTGRVAAAEPEPHTAAADACFGKL